MHNNRIAIKTSIITIIGNILLAIIKFIAGLLSNSGALISDGVHTISDVLTTVIVMVGVTIGNIEEDSNHRYGHERMECIAGSSLRRLI